MTHRIGWDELRFVLAVADHGSLAAAARKLGVNHTTVLRRIQAFEKAHRLRLFDRLPTGYALTTEGEELIVAARSIDDTVATLERRIAGQDLKLEGTIRVTTTDSLMATIVPPHLASFRARHPRITIEMVMTNAHLSLTKRDADVAIRPTRRPPDALVATRAADFGLGIYGARAYLDKNPDRRLRDHVWLAGEEILANAPTSEWMARHVPDVEISFRADSYIALFHAAKAGLGLAGLPCCLADSAPDLCRLRGPDPTLMTGLWLLTHRDLRESARVRAFIDHLAKGFAANRDEIAGRRTIASAAGSADRAPR